MSTPADPNRPEGLPATPATPSTPATPGSELQEPDDQLRPGAGRPLVEGPPASVGEPVSDRRINVTAGISGLVVLGVVGVLTVLVLVILVIAITSHR